jgi:hypothetical protein
MKSLLFKSISADEGAARLRLYAILMYLEQVQAR